MFVNSTVKGLEWLIKLENHNTVHLPLNISLYSSECNRKGERVYVLPALSSPGSVGCDDHLSAVVSVRVVHVELQAFPLVALYQREQVLWLQDGVM